LLQTGPNACPTHLDIRLPRRLGAQARNLGRQPPRLGLNLGLRARARIGAARGRARGVLGS
jgi:hypothetical protein